MLASRALFSTAGRRTTPRRLLQPLCRSGRPTAFAQQLSTAGSGSNGDAVDDALRAVLEDIKSKVAAAEAAAASEAVPGVKTPGAKLRLEFTCTSSECELNDEKDRRVIKNISKKSYEQGVVLVYCPCDNLHLIADNLCWFGDEPSNIESIIEQKTAEIDKLKAEGLLEID